MCPDVFRRTPKDSAKAFRKHPAGTGFRRRTRGSPSTGPLRAHSPHMSNFVLIVLLAAFPALSTDMYLPAIPTLQRVWGISLAEVNLSLVVYFVVFSLLLLVHGPLSDRFGRKPVLYGGIPLFIAGSWMCAASGSITMLVLARMVQATGAASASALSLALAKDLYEGVERQKVFAYVGVIIPLCPMVAPMFGGIMLEHFSWHYIFISQGLLALFSLYGVLRLREPEFEKTMGGAGAMASRYLVLLRNRSYVVYTAAFCVLPAGFFAFVAASSSIYISGFGMTEQTYGLYFGFNALCLMAGSLLCSRLCVAYASTTILYWSLGGVLAGGMAMLATNAATVLQFMLSMGCISFSLGLGRPICNNLILEQVDQDVGAASALLNFAFFLFGAVGMEIISLDWNSKAAVIGVLSVGGAAIPLGALLQLRRAYN